MWNFPSELPGFTRLIAWCRLRRDVRDFRSDRILKLRLEDEVFSGHAGFSLKRYLEAEARSGEFQVSPFTGTAGVR